MFFDFSCRRNVCIMFYIFKNITSFWFIREDAVKETLLNIMLKYDFCELTFRNLKEHWYGGL